VNRRHRLWTSAFLGLTAAVVAAELVAAYTKDEALAPWTHYTTKYVPKHVTFAAIGYGSVWTAIHFARAYKKAGK
jgi:hypothetical protein